MGTYRVSKTERERNRKALEKSITREHLDEKRKKALLG
jgi:hypothetical protein